MARSFRAAARRRASARGRALRPCVRPLRCATVWPLARALPSTAAAGWVCSGHRTLFGRLRGTLEAGPTPCRRGLTVVPWSGAPCGPDGEGPGQRQGLPGPAHEVSVPARGLRPRRLRRHRATAVLNGGACRVFGARRHPGIAPMSGRQTLPARAPVNASRLPLPGATHDSGPGWVAHPALSGTFTLSHPAGLSRHTRTPGVSRR